MDARCISQSVGFFLATGLRSLYGESIKFAAGATLSLANQKEHHQKVSFRDEFITFLKANEIEFDERYV